MTRRNNRLDYRFFDFPDEGDVVRKTDSSSSLYHAFHFLPGQLLSFEATEGDKIWTESWEVKTDFYNNSYLECLRSHSVAYFHNDGVLFYFTQFQGSKKSLLYRFYLAAYRVLLSDEANLELTDEVPLHLYSSSLWRHLNDFIAPIYSLMKAQYTLNYGEKPKTFGDESLVLQSTTRLVGLGTPSMQHEFLIRINNYAIEQLELSIYNSKKKVICRKI
jgi:hypothetical protein